MIEPVPTPQEWHKLYQAVMRVKEVAPWQWMEESDVFGVQNPETGQLGFVSIMGMLGEHLAVAVYLGAEGLYSFWGFQQIADYAPPEALLGIPHLQASFEDRDQLNKKDRDVITEQRLKFRGRQAWPMFRSYRPAMFPWYLEVWEVRFLAHALEQAVDVALRYKENPELLDTADDLNYLVRVPREEQGVLVWEDQIVTVPPPEPEPIAVVMDVDELEYVKQLNKSNDILEVDFFMFLAPIQESYERPYYPHMLLVVESGSGIVLGSELLKPEPGILEMWGMVPDALMQQFANTGTLPRQIKVRTPLLAQLFQPLAEELGFTIKTVPVLQSLEQVRRLLLQQFG